MSGRVIVLGQTPGMARRWCEAERIDPRTPGVYVLGNGGSRGFSITPDDRVVLVGAVPVDAEIALRCAFLPGVEVERVTW